MSECGYKDPKPYVQADVAATHQLARLGRFLIRLEVLWNHPGRPEHFENFDRMRWSIENDARTLGDVAGFNRLTKHRKDFLHEYWSAVEDKWKDNMENGKATVKASNPELESAVKHALDAVVREHRAADAARIAELERQLAESASLENQKRIRQLEIDNAYMKAQLREAERRRFQDWNSYTATVNHLRGKLSRWVQVARAYKETGTYAMNLGKTLHEMVAQHPDTYPRAVEAFNEHGHERATQLVHQNNVETRILRAKLHDQSNPDVQVVPKRP